jgi:putative ABC transport system permease protein
MAILNELLGRLRTLTRRRQLEQDLDDELAFHLAMREAEHRKSGLAADAARTLARRQFGNTASLKEQTRDVWLFASLESWLQDVRFGVRTLRRAPAFALMAILILTAAVGVPAAMFTLVDALILRPVPFDEPENLAFISMGIPSRGGRSTVAPAVLRAWRDTRAFAGAESAMPGIALVEANGTVISRGIARVSPGLFDMLGGVRPVRGRLFDRSEGLPGTADRVLLSEDVWRTVFHANPSLVGSRITSDGEALLVVGILPSDFRFPNWDTVIWRAFDAAAATTTELKDFPRMYVRLSDSLPRPDALRLATTAARAADARNARLEPIVRPLARDVLDPYYRKAVPLLAGGVVLVFLVLCGNLASLMLARLTERQREFGMRSALGASRARVMCQAIAESGIIGAAGTAGGIGLAWALVSLARGFLPESILLRTLNPLDIDVRSLAAASAAGLAAVCAGGILPAWIGTHVDPLRSMRISERGGTGTTRVRTVSRALLIGEVALACTLLAGATVLVRSFINLATADRGLDSSGVVTAWVSFDRPSLKDPSLRASLVRSIEEEVRKLPGVQQFAWSGGNPPAGGTFSWGDWQSDVPGAAPVHLEVNIYDAGPDFFDLYGIPVLRGRPVAADDTSDRVLVGERIANALWPGMDPIGRRFTFENERFEVVGVVGELSYPSLNPGVDTPEFYRHLTSIENDGQHLNIRCAATCFDTALLRYRLRSVHPDVEVVYARPLEDAYFEQLAQPRAAAALASAFSVIATFAAAAGLFAVLTYAVGRRLREFGIRIALGASPGELHRLVLREGLMVALWGIALGVSASWFLARIMASLEYGVTLSDPGNWATVLGSIAVTTMFASWRPARTASRVDPVMLLKDE